MRMRTGVAALGALLTLALAGCSSSDTPEVPRHPKAPVPADRDQQALFATLGGIDPCARLRAAARGLPESPKDLYLFSSSPHTCNANLDELGFYTLTVGESLSTRERYAQQSVDLGEVQGYQPQSKEDTEICRFDIPTSFRTSVSVSASNTKSGCDYPRALATAVAARLDEPVGDRRPKWDACSALAALHRGDPAPGAGTVGIDSCGIDADGTATAPSLQLSYGDDPAKDQPGTAPARIDGHRVHLDTASCTARWSQGPSGVAFAPSLNVDLLLGQGCTDLQRMVTSVMTILDSQPPSGPRLPRLTYRTDEPDGPAAGACEDFDPGKPCEPYHRVGVPTDKDETLEIGEQDPNMACAVAEEMVRGRLGPKFRPITSDGECVFVEPERRVRLHVELATDPLTYAGALNDRDITVAGHPAMIGDVRFGRTVAVASGDSRENGGHVEFTMDYQLPADGTEPDLSGTSALRPLAADIVARYFR